MFTIHLGIGWFGFGWHGLPEPELRLGVVSLAASWGSLTKKLRDLRVALGAARTELRGVPNETPEDRARRAGE